MTGYLGTDSESLIINVFLSGFHSKKNMMNKIKVLFELQSNKVIDNERELLGASTMNDVPLSIRNMLGREKFSCSNCNNFFSPDDLTTIGIKQGSKKPHNDVLVIGLLCQKCKELILFEVGEMGLLDLAFEILENETSDQIREKEKELDEELQKNRANRHLPKKKVVKKSSSSSITIQEVKDAKSFLKKFKYHDDFLMELGMTPEEVDESKSNKEKKYE